MGTEKYTQSAGGLIVNESREVLLVQEYGQYWGLPRGHLEKGESSLEAAQREIYEETGITDLVFCAELGSYRRSTYGKDGLPNFNELKHITIFLFRCAKCDITPIDSQITDSGWFDVENAMAKMINQADISFFESCLPKITAI